MKRDAFSNIHPAVQMGAYACIMAVTMIVMHPVMLIISFASAIAYNFLLKRAECFKFMLKVVLPFMAFAVVINPLFNHEGMTIITYINDNPITKEAIIYGIYSSMMFGSVLMWFSCFNATVTSDKLIYVFAKILPSLSIVISMTLRFVPHFRKQMREIELARQGVGEGIKGGKIKDRAKNSVAILSAMTGLALEGSIETADSMRSRGFASTKRTVYTQYKFKISDTLVTLVFALSLGIIIFACVTKELKYVFYPVFVLNSTNIFSVAVYVLFALMCMMPIAVNALEEITWRVLRSKI